MKFIHENEGIFLQNNEGKRIGGITFTDMGGGVVDITHTYVDRSLRGQGIAGKLMTELTQTLRANNKKACPTCSYAVDWFERHTECADIFVKQQPK